MRVEMFYILGPAVLVLIIVAVLARPRTTFDPPEGSAIDGPINFDAFRSDPTKLDRIADKVSSVGVIRLEILSGKGDNFYYEIFAIDSNGLPVTFAKENKHASALEKARWLAAKLDVPLDDQTGEGA